ncbi:MAG: metallophosphoesterase [Chloroflexota bacterium]|nr:metallophosphoesterase [Chloroflexota bacterium]
MATSQIATSTRPDYRVPAASSTSSTPHSARPAQLRRPERNPFDPTRITYTRAWFQAGVATAIVGALGLRRFGWPLAAGLGGLGAASIAYMRRFEPTHPTLERVTLHLPTLPPALDGLRIGQITDTHLGMPFTADNLRWAVEQMRREQPDLIALTGDLAGLRDGIPEIPPLLSGLRAPLGVYAVPGNHDYWEGLADVRAALMLADIPLLMNEHRHLRWNGADFWLAGIDEIWDGSPNMATALEGVPRDAFTVLLAHSPDIADNAADYGFALQLSGHTHGGHLRLPLIGPFARPRYGLRYVMGLYQIGAMTLYVSRGLGGLPMRLLCRPEATILTLRCGR